jgi:hypothetical protein
MIDSAMISMSSDPLPCQGNNLNNCSYLTYDSNTGLYVNQASVTKPSIFKRSISVIINGGSSDEIKIVSVVSWKDKSTPHQITLSENLLNWIQP